MRNSPCFDLRIFPKYIHESLAESVIPAAHACRQAPVEPGYGNAGIQRL